MPTVDLETLIRGGSGDGRVICETLIHSTLPLEKPDLPQPDFPAESFRLPKEDEIEWLDCNAFYERKRSARGIRLSNFGSNSSSRRISVKSNAPILGLPKLPNSGRLCRPSCRRPSIRFFPKQTGKPEADPPQDEPSSPKVSCIGRVRSKRDKRRRRESRHAGRRPREEDAKAEAAKKEPGVWRKLRSMLRFGRRRRSDAVESEDKVGPAESGADLVDDSFVADSFHAEKSAGPSSVSDPPGLGALKRFSSGRRPASWGGDEPELDQFQSEPAASEIWQRRAAVAPPESIECERDFKSAGPASV